MASSLETTNPMDALRARYAATFPQKRDALVETWTAYAQARDGATHGRLSMQLHRLCGSAASYGYVDLGARACSADRLCGDVAEAIDGERFVLLESAVYSVVDALEHPAEPVRS